MKKIAPRYKLLYIIVAWLVTSIVLMNYSANIQQTLPGVQYFPEYLVLIAHLAIQASLVYKIDKKKVFAYLEQNITTSLIGAIILIPLLILRNYVSQPFMLLYFLFTAGIILLEHIRRVNLLKLPHSLTISWVLFRTILLILIIQL